MQNNVIDLIIFLVRRIRIGDKLNEVKLDALQGYDNAEISAAWSWVLQKQHSGELKYPKKDKIKSSRPKAHRVLHYAERMMITKEAYGYLLELNDMGLIGHSVMEKIIEQAMLHSTEQITLAKAKEMVVKIIFANDDSSHRKTMFLKGNESIN
ncbi:MAG: DUF494 family protein [Balneolales bacterium]